jgi:hypothetical protein
MPSTSEQSACCKAMVKIVQDLHLTPSGVCRDTSLKTITICSWCLVKFLTIFTRRNMDEEVAFYIAIEVCVAWEVCVENKFFDSMCLAIKQNVNPTREVVIKVVPT